MGAKSTAEVLRSEALLLILSRLHEAPNEKIADVLGELVGDEYLLNFFVVDRFDDDYGWFRRFVDGRLYDKYTEEWEERFK